MKNLFSKITASVKVLDVFRVTVLSFINGVYFGCFLIIMAFIAFFLSDYLSPNIDQSLAIAIGAIVPLTAWMILVAILIRSLKVWLYTLPVQYVISLVVMCYTIYVNRTSPETSFFSCAGMVGVLILAELVPVSVGHFIRITISYFIRFIRKITVERNRID